MQEEFFLKLLVRSKKNTSARNLYIHSFIFLAFFCLKPLSYIGDETEVSALLALFVHLQWTKNRNVFVNEMRWRDSSILVGR